MEWETDKNKIKNKKIQKEIYNINGDSFTEYFDQYLKYLEANNFFGTLDKAKATYSKLHKFCKSDKILFKEIDVDFLKKFEKYLRDQLGNRINTIHANLKMMGKLLMMQSGKSYHTL
ncbi:MAG: phage integrase SAM-like domain-containing protein [Bacteroidetes bacterium]|nr:phage integrase SAM-like domain-containing protein [Bacteroidota bacterium]